VGVQVRSWGGALRELPTRTSCGSSVTTLAPAARLSALRIDDAWVYWAALGDEATGAGAGVFRVAKP